MREHVLDVLPAYALDALDTEEARAVDAHLATCAECQRELDRLRAVTDSLATAVAPVAPPPALRRALLDAVMPVRRRDMGRRWTWVGAAVAAGMVVALAAGVVAMNARLQALQARLAAQEQALALLTAPGARAVALTGTARANGRFILDPGRGQGVLIVTDLRDPGRELVYQLWLVGDGGPESAGVFRPDPDRPVIVPVAANFGRYQAVAISVERAPFGASQPTSVPILIGNL